VSAIAESANELITLVPYAARFLAIGGEQDPITLIPCRPTAKHLMKLTLRKQWRAVTMSTVLTGTVALVTGATSGIGKATAFAVNPGPTRSEGTAALGEAIDEFAALAPAGRPASPDEIAAAITYLASDDASFVHGVIFAVDGGRTAAR
jgi:enoyl-ACP reductase-like protein